MLEMNKRKFFSVSALLLIVGSYAASDGVVISYGPQKDKEWIESREYGGVRIGMSRSEAKSTLEKKGFKIRESDNPSWKLVASGRNNFPSENDICISKEEITVMVISEEKLIDRVTCIYEGKLKMENPTRVIFDPLNESDF